MIQGLSLQGPFTEKFVGGRYYRHTELNDGTDTRENRAEGFRLTLGLDTGSAGDTSLVLSEHLGIVPPNYPFVDSPSRLCAPRMASRSTNSTAIQSLRRRSVPVNIKNILMTTASVGTRLSGTITHNAIGNYQKNYQVIQTAGRSINDPFFQDQSFRFCSLSRNASDKRAIPALL